MSWRLVEGVFDSALPAWLKPYAAAVATFAAEDGSRVYPTRARIARMVGKSERSTQRALQHLRDRGVLIIEVAARQHCAPRYKFRAIALPQAGEPVQLPLFPQPTRPALSQKGAEARDLFHNFHSRQQPGETPVTVRGVTGVSRSVSDPSRASTYLKTARAREQANARKTGT